jgi:hypothetical protein
VGDHAGLVHDQDVSLVEDPGRLVQIDQEPGHGRRRDTRGGLELVRGTCRQPQAHRPIAGIPPDRRGSGQRVGLAASGPAHHHLNRVARRRDPANHLGLFADEVLPGCQSLLDDHGRDGTASATGAGRSRVG